MAQYSEPQYLSFNTLSNLFWCVLTFNYYHSFNFCKISIDSSSFLQIINRGHIILSRIGHMLLCIEEYGNIWLWKNFEEQLNISFLFLQCVIKIQPKVNDDIMDVTVNNQPLTHLQW